VGKVVRATCKLTRVAGAGDHHAGVNVCMMRVDARIMCVDARQVIVDAHQAVARASVTCAHARRVVRLACERILRFHVASNACAPACEDARTGYQPAPNASNSNSNSTALL
jgi:hypothetical protein